ncbi:MAG: UDP-N-acetylmuramoyl-L-alanine--D-glutamate ligase [Actinomycetota bacterium]|nr:UDP-N-acetylmuramoyl-L-alanine--D-glutamate ligase [Actinomycetota bacterium]
MRTLILGAAVSGGAAAQLASGLHHEVSIYDRSSESTIPLREKGYAVHTGEWADRLLVGIDLVVASPGFPEHAEPIQRALDLGIEIISELEFGSQHLTVPYVAVTGTNGKTTVTNTITDMLNESSISAVSAGNIGTPVTGLGDTAAEVVVLEASSFQLRFIDRFHPVAAGIVNIAADHLDWHGSVAAYGAAKARIFENMTPNDIVVYGADDPGAVEVVASAECRTIGVSGCAVSGDGVGPIGGSLQIDGKRFATPTTDPSWLTDLGIAAVMASSVGATDAGIGRVLAGFVPGPHRRRTVGTYNGITWIDDSKATNPHAARAAAEAYPSVVLLAGGRNKDLDLSTIAPASVRHVVAFGEAAPSIASAVGAPVTVVEDLAAAVGAAGRIAEAGDTVLLAPGCASFDQFDSYASRGDHFAELVAALEAAK